MPTTLQAPPPSTDVLDVPINQAASATVAGGSTLLLARIARPRIHDFFVGGPADENIAKLRRLLSSLPTGESLRVHIPKGYPERQAITEAIRGVKQRGIEHRKIAVEKVLGGCVPERTLLEEQLTQVRERLKAGKEAKLAVFDPRVLEQLLPQLSALQNEFGDERAHLLQIRGAGNCAAQIETKLQPFNLERKLRIERHAGVIAAALRERHAAQGQDRLGRIELNGTSLEQILPQLNEIVDRLERPRGLIGTVRVVVTSPEAATLTKEWLLNMRRQHGERLQIYIEGEQRLKVQEILGIRKVGEPPPAPPQEPERKDPVRRVLGWLKGKLGR